MAGMLDRLGAVVFDADELARRAVEPGTEGHRHVADRFGAGALAPDGRIDRPALAETVFSDPAARRDLESIVHPEVFRLLEEGVEPYRDSDRVVVFDAPLIVETGRQDAFDVLVVVSCSLGAQIARLVTERGFSERGARARIAAQLPLEEKARVADVVLDNDGTLEELEKQVRRLWAGLRARAGSDS